MSENEKVTILVVDDEEWNRQILILNLKPHGYEVVTANNGQEALKAVSDHSIDLILLDVMMPGMDGFEVCREIKKNKMLQSIPIILVTALKETSDKVTGLEAGAADFLTKPIDKAELTARVRAHLRIRSLMQQIESWNSTLEQKIAERIMTIREKNRQLDDSYHHTLEALIMALDAREHETGKHSLRVAVYTTELAKMAGIGGRDLEEIAMGALLHDIGKIGISDTILLKPDKLTDAERLEINRHPEIGYQMVKDIDFIGRGRDLILSHQEKFDGSGYPRQIKGEEIYVGARFFAIADVFDALMSERPYKRAFSFAESQQIIKEGVGTHFDPKLVEHFFAFSENQWKDLADFVERSTFRDLIKRIRENPSAIPLS